MRKNNDPPPPPPQVHQYYHWLLIDGAQLVVLHSVRFPVTCLSPALDYPRIIYSCIRFRGCSILCNLMGAWICQEIFSMNIAPTNPLSDPFFFVLPVQKIREEELSKNDFERLTRTSFITSGFFNVLRETPTTLCQQLTDLRYHSLTLTGFKYSIISACTYQEELLAPSCQ